MKCKTNGAIYEISIHTSSVVCKVTLPADFVVDQLKIFKIPIGRLEQRIHDGMEHALAPLFEKEDE